MPRWWKHSWSGASDAAFVRSFSASCVCVCVFERERGVKTKRGGERERVRKSKGVFTCLQEGQRLATSAGQTAWGWNGGGTRRRNEGRCRNGRGRRCRLCRGDGSPLWKVGHGGGLTVQLVGGGEARLAATRCAAGSFAATRRAEDPPQPAVVAVKAHRPVMQNGV